MKHLLQRYFKLNETQTSIKTECIAGISSFLTMAYIVVVNPIILGGTGMNPEAVFVATCLVAAFGSILMGLLANYPMGLAPSMGLNAYFSYVVVKEFGYSWEVALGAVFCSGIVFLLLSAIGIRQWLIRMMPLALKIGITAGIGLFLTVIALQNLKVMTVMPAWSFHPEMFTHINLCLALLGLALIFLLNYFRVQGAILIGILAVTVIGILLKITPFQGIFSLPPGIKPTLFALQLPNFADIKLLMIIFTFFFISLFDNTGTLIAISQQAHLIKPDGGVPNLKQALMVDSTATITGSLLGTSSIGNYIESSVGVRAGGRTGLTAIVIGIMFFLTLFLAPLAKTIPDFATAPVLFYVATLMIQRLRLLQWREYVEVIAALITAVSIPLTFSIADGVCWGVISYVILKIITRKTREIHPVLACLMVIFVAFLIYQYY